MSIVIVPASGRSFRHTLKRQQETAAPAAVAVAVEADDVVQQLQVAFHRTRVRPIEYMRDYDKLNSSKITPNQFECGLSLACSAPGWQPRAVCSGLGCVKGA